MNVIDALVVTLGLDASAYRKSAADTRADQGKVVEQSDKMAKRLESDGKRAAQSFRSVRNEVAGLLLAFTGAATLRGFASSLIVNDAAVGRLATNLGMATEQVSAWEGAIKRVGGDAKDADAALQSMAAAFQSYKLTGTTGKDADFQGLGVSLNDLQDPAGALLKIAEASERMSRPEFVARAGRLGLSDATINLLAKGRAGTQGLVDDQYKLGVATDESSRAAQKFEETLARVDSLLREKVRPIVTEMLEWFEQWAGDTDNLSLAVGGLLIVLGGLSLWVLAAAAPWIAFAAAIAAVVYGLDRLKSVAAALLAGDFKGAWNALTTGDTMGSPDVSRVSGDWMSRANAGLPSAGGRGPNAGIIAYLKRAGFSNEQARGIDAGIGAEGGAVGAVNPKSGAFGIGQWLGSRKQGLFARYGRNPSQEQQLAYLVWELNGGDHGGRAVRGQSTAEGTLNAYITRFMRPKAGYETTSDLSRGMGILGGRAPVGVGARGGTGGSSTNTTSVGQITVYVPSGDPDTIASGIRGAIVKRGLVVQSGSGMNP
jgi:hypothetical protein